jgi:cysteine desulfurase
VTEIYLDNSATTRPYPEAIEAATRAMTDFYANPSSSHLPGRQSCKELRKARRSVSRALGCLESEVFFTSGGTESNNLAIFGTASLLIRQGNKIITTAVEHAAVTKAIRILRRQGWKVEYIPSPGYSLDLDALEAAIDERTVLVSAMLVNNEVGCIFPIKQIGEIIKAKGSKALLHTDAVQAFGKIPFTPSGLGADLVSISAHKIHGIKGSGALYVRKGLKLHAHQFGGGQERGLRSGTESMPSIAAFGKAAQLMSERFEADRAHMATLREYCLQSLTVHVPGVTINSSSLSAPHILSFSLAGVNSARAVRYLSGCGIYVSDGAACKSHYKSKGPQVLESFGLSQKDIYSVIRVSFCAENTKNDVDALVSVLVEWSRSSYSFL